MYQAHVFQKFGIQCKFGKPPVGSFNHSCYYRCVYFQEVYQCHYSDKCFFFLYHIKQTPPETFASTSRDSIKLSLSCLRSLSTLCYNLVHRHLVISSFHITVNWSLHTDGTWWVEVAGIPDVLVRYKHARKLEIKHRKFGEAYNLSTFLEDPMGYSKQAISSKVKSQCAFPLKNRHNVNPWVAIRSDWLWRQYGSG